MIKKKYILLIVETLPNGDFWNIHYLRFNNRKEGETMIAEYEAIRFPNNPYNLHIEHLIYELVE